MSERRGADAPRRICLVSPGHVSFNPRLVKEADALQAAGFQVHVVAAGNVPYLRVYDAEIFSRAEWSWETVSYSSEAHRQFLRVRRRLARALVKSGSRNLTVMAFAHHLLAGPLTKAVMRYRADLYIAHYVAAIPVVAAAASRHRALAGFDAEDFHSGEFDDAAQASLDAIIVKTLEKAYLPTFTHFTAASPGIAAAYTRLFPNISPVPILNVFPLGQAPACPTAMHCPGDQINAHWFSQTIGENRGLETVIAAMARSKCRVDLHVRGTWQQGYREKLRRLAESLGVLSQLHELPIIGPAEIERGAAAYDIGLVCETGHSENRQIALTNKIFSYMLAGLAIAATDIDAHRQLEASGVDIWLYEANDVGSLADIFDRIKENPSTLLERRTRMWCIAQSKYNWSVEKKILTDLIKMTLQPA